MAFISLDSRDLRQLGPIERATRHDHESRAHHVTTISSDNPSALLFAPGDCLDLSLKAGVAIEIEFLADAARMLQDLRSVGISLLRNVASLLEQRQVDV